MQIDIETVTSALDGNYILVFTTNSKEKEAVNAILTNRQRASVAAPNDGAQLALIADRFVLHLTGTSGAQRIKSIGSIYTALHSRPLFPKPLFVVVCGIAWGNPHHVEVGDVVVSSEVLAVNHRRARNGTISYRHEQKISSLAGAEDLVAMLRQALEGRQDIETGPIASGETYYDDTAARDELIRQFPDIRAGEMESFGLLDHLGGSAWLVVRGISDLGEDGASQAPQGVAAQRAAFVLHALIKLAQSAEALPLPRNDSAVLLLKTALAGEAFHIGRDDHGECDLSWYLNNEVAPGLLARLTGYAVGDTEPQRLARDLTDVLLEIAPNALRYGTASRATISFHETSVELADDGRAYELEGLQGNRGGAHAWSQFKRAYIAPGLIEFSSVGASRRNRYRFRFARLDQELNKAKAECHAVTQSLHAREATKLTFSEECEGVYFNTAALLMSSVRQSITEELKRILQSGRSLYLSCWDEWERATYEEALVEFEGPRLHIFLEGARLAKRNEPSRSGVAPEGTDS